MKKPGITLGIIQGLVAFSAIPAGILLIIQPDGSSIGLPLKLLEDSPFVDFLIPGLFLLIVNGIFNVAGAVISFKQKLYAGKIGVFLGLLLVLWILVQVYFTKGFIFFLQTLFLVVGLVEIIVAIVLIKKQKSS